MLLESAFHQLFCLKCSFKLFTFCKSCARKQKWIFFSERSVEALSHLRWRHTSRSHWLNYKSPPPAKAAKRGHRAPLPAIEQFEVNCAASISTTMHSLQLCREKFFLGGGGLAQGPPDPRGPLQGQLLRHWSQCTSTTVANKILLTQQNRHKHTKILTTTYMVVHIARLVSRSSHFLVCLTHIHSLTDRQTDRQTHVK